MQSAYAVRMAHTKSTPNPGTLLARARWSRPENLAKRVERLVRELATIAPDLSADQVEQLRSALDRKEAAA